MSMKNIITFENLERAHLALFGRSFTQAERQDALQLVRYFNQYPCNSLEFQAAQAIASKSHDQTMLTAQIKSRAVALIGDNEVHQIGGVRPPLLLTSGQQETLDTKPIKPAKTLGAHVLDVQENPGHSQPNYSHSRNPFISLFYNFMPLWLAFCQMTIVLSLFYFFDWESSKQLAIEANVQTAHKLRVLLAQDLERRIIDGKQYDAGSGMVDTFRTVADRRILLGYSGFWRYLARTSRQTQTIWLIIVTLTILWGANSAFKGLFRDLPVIFHWVG